MDLKHFRASGPVSCIGPEKDALSCARRYLDFVPLEEVVFILAWAFGTAQAADHQDRYPDRHH
jgi:hypothetical protein